MATKTISLELDAYEKLRRAKREGESFSAVVRRARFAPCDATGASILKALEAQAAHDADRDAAAYWERNGWAASTRTASPPVWEEVGGSS